MRYGVNSTPPYLYRRQTYQTDASMKRFTLRALPIMQSDLFDSAPASAPLTSLQLHRDELVELLSQLLWQLARHADIDQQLEDDDEQDQS